MSTTQTIIQNGPPKTKYLDLLEAPAVPLSALAGDHNLIANFLADERPVTAERVRRLLGQLQPGREFDGGDVADFLNILGCAGRPRSAPYGNGGGHRAAGERITRL